MAGKWRCEARDSVVPAGQGSVNSPFYLEVWVPATLLSLLVPMKNTVQIASICNSSGSSSALRFQISMGGGCISLARAR